MSPPNPDIDPVLAWVKQEHAMIWQQLELMEAGKIGTIDGMDQRPSTPPHRQSSNSK